MPPDMMRPVAGAATIYSCCLILATLAFWFIRVDNVLIVLLTFWEAGRWPVDVYPLWLRSMLTFLGPGRVRNDSAGPGA